MSEKLCLKWNDFQESINNTFGGLRDNLDFIDVTLACEDGEQVEAHKVILAASSPFFQDILKKNKHPHPLIYMRGVRSEHLIAILDFLYFGETNVDQENLDSFLAIAQELKLKGLMEQEDGINEKEQNRSYEAKLRTNYRHESKAPVAFDHISFESGDYKTELISTQSGTNIRTVATQGSNAIKNLDEQVKSMMEKSQNPVSSERKRRADICKVCGKEGEGMVIKNHIEANHLVGISIPCNDCEATFRSRKLLRYHKTVHHKEHISTQRQNNFM